MQGNASYIGVDLGQRKDFSAITVVERRQGTGSGFDYVNWRQEEAEPGFTVQYVERIRLGTPYREVARRVAEVARHPLLSGPRRVIVDATGVGMPVIEMLRASGPGCEIAAVVITGGALERFDRGLWHVPRVDLLAGLQGMLERGELKIPRQMKGVGMLVRELIGSGTAGGHDDLVFAVALACWSARKAFVGEVGKRLL